ncbi:MAG: RND-type multidrug efflux pump permease component [Oceanicaulis sp. HLUCCA04]|nr:MAG: RND-type multidrug efflux pump permease component [Oceanicaulis sp. HLUCCA04]
MSGARPSGSPGEPADQGFPGAGLIRWFADNPVAANLLMILLLLSGAISAATMRTEVFPAFTPRTVIVSVLYPGATPEDVEQSITRRIEEAVIGLDGVREVRATAAESVGTITIEISEFANPRIVRDDVQTAVDSLVSFPPADAEQPQIRIPQPTTTVLTLVLTGAVDEAALRRAAEQVERDLMAVNGISTVQLRGVRPYEISISVSEDALRAYELTFGDVAQALRAASIDLSGGQIRTEAGEFLLRTNARAETGAAFEDIVLRASPDGARVRVRDVATVTDGFSEDPLISQFNGQPAAFVDVQLRGNEDLLSVRARAVEYIGEAVLPPGISISVASDQSQVFRDRVSLLARNAILGFTLVFLLLVLMLDLRLAFWVALGVPIAFLGGFTVFGAAGVTLNFITTFGLIIVLGIVVDAAIVVGENTDRERMKGRSNKDAALAGITGVAAPVLVGVLTTVAAFGPLVFVTGTFGEITRPIPILVISILVISLIVAFFILPTQLAGGSTWSRGPMRTIQMRVDGLVAGFADTVLRSWTRFAGQMRYLVALAGFCVLIACFTLLGTGTVRFVFFPDIEADSITASLALPTGAPFEATRAAATRMLDEAEAMQAEYAERGEPVFESISTVIGGRTSLFGGPGSVSSTSIASHLAQIEIRLVPSSQRRLSSTELEREWRGRIGQLAGVERLTFTASAGPQDPDIAYQLSHPDNAQLERAVNRLVSGLRDIDAVSGIDSGYELGKRQLDFALTPAGDSAGLRAADIARQARQAFFGEEIQRIQRGSEEVRVFVRYPQDERTSLDGLSSFRVRAADGAAIPLSVAADITETRSVTAINSVDGRRVIEVTADVDRSILTPDDARARVESELLSSLQAEFPRLRWELSGAGADQAEDFASIGQGFLFAIIIMYALLATQLGSYVQPLVILIAIPFGVGGAIFGHFIMGYDVSFPSIFGMVALSGVVVNASIVLMDRYNFNVGRGYTPAEAISEATARRFRPILITTLTTAFGLLPIMLETSPQAQFLVPMTISLGIGLLFASALILLLLPAFVLIVEDLRGIKVREVQPEAEPAE